jgi:hypothetical protein
MEDREVELAVGESIEIGGIVVTLLEIEGDEIHLRFDADDGLPLADEQVQVEERSAPF